MGKIIKNGVVYGGTSNIAGNISYDNTGTQLNAITVQNAITELKILADNATEQKTTLPTASSANLGKIYQYVGTTSGSYTNGMFYKCVVDDDTANPVTYKWEQINVQNSVAFDTAPTSGSANAVTSDGVYRYTAGQKEYTNNILRGEIFNTYSGNNKNIASGDNSHAEGQKTYASGVCAHTEGYNTSASGYWSHAEGVSTSASGYYSHAGGIGTQATEDGMTVIGKFNNPKTNSLFEIGNGSQQGNETQRSNILEVSDSYMNLNGTLKINNTAIGSLAMKSSATGTALVNAGTLPSLTYNSTTEELTFSAGTLPTSGTVTVS